MSNFKRGITNSMFGGIINLWQFLGYFIYTLDFLIKYSNYSVSGRVYVANILRALSLMFCTRKFVSVIE